MTFQNELEPTAIEAEQNDLELELFEVAGRIKWFDVSKGYGFVIPDDGSVDILLHVTILRRSGFQTAFEGARVVCEAQKDRKVFKFFVSSQWMRRQLFTHLWLQ